ncbi:Vph2p, partial [Sporobolomyces salmoneus]|uniref:Vph2p n=1 Tax=Sporobolomyces salmoneus TaxID=183962 RepID=UPI00318228CA
SPELLAILSSIQLSQDRIHYSSLTSLNQPSYRSVLPLTDIHESKNPKTVAEEWGQIKKELSAIVNVLVSMAAVFTGVWYVGFGYSHPIRLGLSLLGAVTIAAIEGWLYWRVFKRVEQGKKEAEKWRTGGREGGPGQMLM